MKTLTTCLLIVFVGFVGFGIGVNSTITTEPKIITLDNNPKLESRLQSEIESNQEMSKIITEILDACNEKLLDKYNSANEKLKKENEILQKALSKYRET